jgi:hypothetical protein
VIRIPEHRSVNEARSMALAIAESKEHLGRNEAQRLLKMCDPDEDFLARLDAARQGSPFYSPPPARPVDSE